VHLFAKDNQMKKTVLILTSVLGLIAGMAMADSTLPDIADTDGSGAWSLTELQALWPDMSEEVFASLDTGVDGAVDMAELTAALEAGTLTLPAQ
jgi:hypothetical protein